MTESTKTEKELAAEIAAAETTTTKTTTETIATEAAAAEAAARAAKPKKGGFDINAPYGTVHGGETNAVYYQNGKYFDGGGKPVKGL